MNNLILRACIFALLTLSNGAHPEDIVFWHVLNGEIPDHTVESFYTQTGHQIYSSRLTAETFPIHLKLAAIHSTEPTIALFPSDQLFGAKKLAPIPRILVDKNLNVSPDGKSILLNDGNPMLLFYNKKLVHQQPSTFNELLAFKETNVIAVDLSSVYFTNPFLTLYGAFDTDGNIGTDFDDQFKQYIRFIKSLLTSQKISNKCLLSSCINELFLTGQSPFAIAGSWTYDGLKNILGDDLGLMPFPALDGKQIKSMRIPNAITFSEASSQEGKDIASLFLIELTRQLTHANNQNPIIEPMIQDSYIPKNMAFVGCMFKNTNFFETALDSETTPTMLNKQLENTHIASICHE